MQSTSGQTSEKAAQYAEVAFPIPIDFRGYKIDSASTEYQSVYTYIIPSHLLSIAQVGCRVIAPLGKSRREGVIIKRNNQTKIDISKIKLRNLIDCLEETPSFSANMLHLTRWVAEYYLSSWGEVLGAAIPGVIRTKQKQIYKLIADAETIATFGYQAKLQRRILDLLQEENNLTRTQISRRLRRPELALRSPLSRLAHDELIEVSSKFQPKSQTQYKNLVSLVHKKTETKVALEKLKNAPKQTEVLELLLDSNQKDYPNSTLIDQTGCSLSTLRSLEKKGLICFKRKKITRNPLSLEPVVRTHPLPLNPEQDQAVSSITQSVENVENTTFLLHGITGSGKTEVYLQSIAKVLEKEKSAILLVPEISLTPQTVSHFVGRFGDLVAVLHSRLSDGERHDQWQRIRSGIAKIVIGARSAVFAPLENLGLIVIDEEHESSYKQDSTPRYHARNVAAKRSEIENCTLVLGSATPALETYRLAKHNKYRLLTLTNRATKVGLPDVAIIDMRQELKRGNRTIFSQELKASIIDRLKKKQQVILFLNRRGHSSYVFCRECGYIERCHNCDISLTFHLTRKQLICHHCATERATVDHCPSCGSMYIRYFGLGTEKVEQQVKINFPQACVHRMDMDTTSTKDGHQKILQTFQEGKIDILIGTQMIAKGLDFPNVTLVGVISADTSLNLPDFRSGERTFNLLTQVAGRSGRGPLGGNVVIQTYLPEHQSIQAAQTHDYIQFYQEEIDQRRHLKYPPFSHSASILMRCRDEKVLIENAHQLFEVFSRFQIETFIDVQIRGPAPAPLSKIKNQYRWHFLILHVDHCTLLRFLKKSLAHYTSFQPKVIDLTIDIDPINTL